MTGGAWAEIFVNSRSDGRLANGFLQNTLGACDGVLLLVSGGFWCETGYIVNIFANFVMAIFVGARARKYARCRFCFCLAPAGSG